MAAKRLGDACAIWLFWLVPAFIAFQLMRLNIHLGFFAADFRGNVWDARHTLLAGQNPYPSLDTLRALAGTGVPFTYPPLILWLALPFSPLPLVAAEAIWSVGLVVGVAAALRLVGVRDWRCFGIVLGSVPVLQGLSSGSPTLLFVPLLALAWRYRDRRWVGPAAVGIAVGLKLFLWPLLVWFVATRRVRSAVVATAIAGVGVLGTWALIGFQGLVQYPDLLRTLVETAGFKYMSISALGTSLGVPAGPAHLIQYASGIGLLAAGALFARSDDGDRRAFSAMVAAALVLTPVVWVQNLALLFIPLALKQSRLGTLWLASFAAYWFDAVALARGPHPVLLGGGGPMLWRCVVVLGFMSAVVIACTKAPPRERRKPTMRMAVSQA